MKHSFSGLLVLLFFFGAILLSSGCKTEGCTNSEALNFDPKADKDDGSCELRDPTLLLNMNVSADGNAFSYGQLYSLPDGRRIRINTARFYFSGITIGNSDGDIPLTGVYEQFESSKAIYDLGTVPPGEYTRMSFDIGLDSAANFGDPTTWADDHPLSSSSPTFDHWSWNTGYVFIKLEGVVDGSVSMVEPLDDPFVYHVGSMALKERVPLGVDFTIAENGNSVVTLNVDILKFFDGIDLTSEFDTHTFNNMPLAEKVVDNVRLAIEIP